MDAHHDEECPFISYGGECDCGAEVLIEREHAKRDREYEEYLRECDPLNVRKTR